MRTACLIGLILSVLSLLAPAARGQSTTAYGLIEDLDRDNGTLTLLLAPKQERKEFSLAGRDLPVTDAIGQPLQLADLAARQRVALQLGSDSDVTAIRREDECQWGYVVEVRPEKRELVFKEGHLQRTLAVPDRAVLRIDGQEGQFTDIKTGQGIKAVFAPDRRTLLQLQVGKGIGSSPYYSLKHQDGVLLKVDHQRRTIQVIVRGERYTVEEYEYQPEALLRLTHSSYQLRTTDIAALQPYCRIFFYYESDARKVVQVSAEVPVLVRRKAEAVDRSGRQLKINANGSAEQLRVATDAMIRTPAGLGRWEDVAKGDLVSCGLSLDGREIVFVYRWDK